MALAGAWPERSGRPPASVPLAASEVGAAGAWLCTARASVKDAVAVAPVALTVKATWPCGSRAALAASKAAVQARPCAVGVSVAVTLCVVPPASVKATCKAVASSPAVPVSRKPWAALASSAPPAGASSVAAGAAALSTTGSDAALTFSFASTALKVRVVPSAMALAALRGSKNQAPVLSARTLPTSAVPS